jgi:hypothetical protein
MVTAAPLDQESPGWAQKPAWEGQLKAPSQLVAALLFLCPAPIGAPVLEPMRLKQYSSRPRALDSRSHYWRQRTTVLLDPALPSSNRSGGTSGRFAAGARGSS